MNNSLLSSVSSLLSIERIKKVMTDKNLIYSNRDSETISLYYNLTFDDLIVGYHYSSVGIKSVVVKVNIGRAIEAIDDEITDKETALEWSECHLDELAKEARESLIEEMGYYLDDNEVIEKLWLYSDHLNDVLEPLINTKRSRP